MCIRASYGGANLLERSHYIFVGFVKWSVCDMRHKYPPVTQNTDVFLRQATCAQQCAQVTPAGRTAVDLL